MKFNDEERLIDGLLSYGKTETIRDSKRKQIGEKFNSKGDLYFNYKSIRQSDYDLYGTTDQSLDLKIYSFFDKDVEKSHKVLIEKTLYNVTKIDPTNDRKYMYWYLTKVGDLDAI